MGFHLNVPGRRRPMRFIDSKEPLLPFIARDAYSRSELAHRVKLSLVELVKGYRQDLYTSWP